MRKKIGLLFLASFLLNVMTISAQDLDDEVIEMPPRIAKNLLKVNLTSLALNNYSVQYERQISRKISSTQLAVLLVSLRFLLTGGDLPSASGL
ncbi:MAG: hypothetical protein ABIN48_11225, partial [Ginsengibacter sp.]